MDEVILVPYCFSEMLRFLQNFHVATNGDPEGYIDLYSVISFEGFYFSKYYEHEKTILTPRLEELGCTDISFYMGERDSFGPLSRICYFTDPGGNKLRAFYG